MLGLFTIAGGVALILFGVRYLRKALDKLAGTDLGMWTQRFTSNKIRAVLSGLAASLLAPSSTSMSLLAVRAVQAGHMTTRQAMALMFGADVGLTLTVLLISFRAEQQAPILILVGMVLFQLASHIRWRGLGQAILSLGFVFMGIKIIKMAAEDAAHSETLGKLMEIVSQSPMGIAILSALIAMALQSSTATIGLIIALGATGKVTLSTALAVVVGANIGIAVTMLLIGWDQPDSRRLAIGNLSAKLTLSILIMAGVGPVSEFLNRLPGHFDQHVAFAHMGFNISLVMLGLPLLDQFDWLANKCVPDQPAQEDSAMAVQHMMGVGMLENLSLALGQSTREIMCVAESIRGMLMDMLLAMKSNDKQLAKKLAKRTEQLRLLDMEITRLFNLLTDQGEFGRKLCHLRYLIEMETIGRIIANDIALLVQDKIKRTLTFSPEDWSTLDEYCHGVSENLLTAKAAFAATDRELARKLIIRCAQMKNVMRRLRLQYSVDTPGLTENDRRAKAILLGIVTHLWRINRGLTNLALTILQTTQKHPASFTARLTDPNFDTSIDLELKQLLPKPSLS